MNRRYASLVTAVGVTLGLALVGLGATGLRAGLPAVVLMAALTSALVIGLVSLRRARTVELHWGPASGGLGGSAFVPTRVTARPRPPATTRQVAAALGKVEARELAGSPWFGVSIGVCVIAFLILAVLWHGDVDRSWGDFFSLTTSLAHPFTAFVVIGAHRAATRARRDGTDELFDTCPLPAPSRYEALLRTAWVPAVGFSIFLVALLATIAVRNPLVYGPIGLDEVAYVLGALALTVGGVCLGVALGQYWRWGLMPIVAMVVGTVVSENLASIGQPRWHNAQLLATWTGEGEPYSVLFTERPLWWRFGWLSGLTALVVLAGLARHLGRRVAGVAVVTVFVTAGCAYAVVRPLPGPDAKRLASLIDNPGDHQVCIPAGTGDALTVCGYRDAREHAELIASEVAPLATSLPRSLDKITLRQAFDGEDEELPAEVAARLEREPEDRLAGAIRLTLSTSEPSRVAARELVAFAALGIPTEIGEGNHPLVIAGEARGVVAIWIATRGLDSRSAEALATGRDSRNGNPGEGPPDAFDRGYAWPAQCSGRDAPVVWSAQDLRATRLLLSVPPEHVKAVVHADWDRWTDPATGTDELMSALGLATVGPFDMVKTRPDSC